MDTPDSPSHQDCRREFYRLQYPARERPKLWIDQDRSFEVTELSERGLRLTSTESHLFHHGMRVSGDLELPSQSIPVCGTVSRIDGHEVVIVAVSGLSFACLLDEQRRILARFLT